MTPGGNRWRNGLNVGAATLAALSGTTFNVERHLRSVFKYQNCER